MEGVREAGGYRAESALAAVVGGAGWRGALMESFVFILVVEGRRLDQAEKCSAHGATC